MDRDGEDAWLDEYDEKWAKKFNTKQSKLKLSNKGDDKEPAPQDRIVLLKEILEMLQPKESVTAALKRYSGGGTVGAKKGGKNTKGEKGEAGKGGRDMEKFNKLTETADALLSGGYSDIYTDKREDVEDSLSEEIANKATGSSSSSQVMWEYKAADGSLFGPYTSANMRDWRAQGYFTGESAVPIRKVKENKEDDMFADASNGDGDEFVSSDTIDFSLYP